MKQGIFVLIPMPCALAKLACSHVFVVIHTVSPYVQINNDKA